MMRSPLWFCALALACAGVRPGSYEVQVYPGQVREAGASMVELHSNFTAQGSQTAGGVLSANHQEPETVEFTQSWNVVRDRLLYFHFHANGEGWQWVGDYIRPRVAIPEEWKWPVG